MDLAFYATSSKQKLKSNPDKKLFCGSGSHRYKTFSYKRTPQIFWTFHRSCRLSGRKIEIHGYFWQQMWQVFGEGPHHLFSRLGYFFPSMYVYWRIWQYFLSVFVHSVIKYCSNKSKRRSLGYLKGFAIKVVYLHIRYITLTVNPNHEISLDYCHSQ